MSLSRFFKLSLFVCALVVAAAFSAARSNAQVQTNAAPPSLSTIPLIFEKNQGQAPTEYQFLSRRDSIQTYYSADGIDLIVPSSKTSFGRLQLRWVGADHQVSLDGESLLPGHSNYFRGRDESRWLRNVSQFAQVRYAHLYPGIDAVFHGTQEFLEHDFVVQPRADPSQIAFRSNYPARLTSSGDIEFDLEGSKIRLRQPVAYQDFVGGRRQVFVNYVLTENGEVRFSLGDYDQSQTLIIDPIFIFSTYFPGNSNNPVQAMTTDAVGNIYFTGSTSDLSFPITNSSTPLCSTCISNTNILETYISKLDPSGHTLLYSAYLSGGDTGGPYGTVPSSIALDKNGNILISGVSSSHNFPLVGEVKPLNPQNFNQFYFFVASVKPDGSALNYSGLVGGMLGVNSPNYGRLALDSGGNAYLTGTTDDDAFQLTSGTFSSTPTQYPNDRLFLLKLDPTGKLVYSTLVPGNAAPQQGQVNVNSFAPYGIHVDSLGQATIAGTGGAGLPATPGVLLSTIPPSPFVDARMGFALQLDATAGALNFASYVPGVDQLSAMTVDSAGNLYLTGNTNEANLPVSPDAFQKNVGIGANCECNDGFVIKIDAKATKVLAATYLGGTPSSGNAGTLFTSIALDSKSNVIVGGATGSSDFPLKDPFASVLKIGLLTGGELVLAQLSPDLSSLLFGSFLNSTEFDQDSAFATLTVDAQDKVIVAGKTNSSLFPTTPNSYKPTVSSDAHSFIAKLDLATAAPSACPKTDSIDFGFPLVNTPGPQTLAVMNCGNAPLQITGITALPSIHGTQSCGSIAAGANCDVQLTYTPIDTNPVDGTITLTTNAQIPHLYIRYIGQTGIPSVNVPPDFFLGDQLVGTQAELFLEFINGGTGSWIVSNVATTGEFTADNQCTAPVPPMSSAPPFALNFCQIGITFSPAAAGVRSGTLTITDNQAGSPHVIQLNGNGLLTYSTPSIGLVQATASTPQPTAIQVAGNNFFPASQVLVNGSPRVTHYLGEQLLFAEPTVADLTQIGEQPVTVVTPGPGGGTSNTSLWAVYGAIRSIIPLHSVFEPKSSLLYASIRTDSPTHANQVIVVDPTTATIVHSWNVGNGPNRLAISDDGTLLYVGLDGDNKVAQVALPSGAINFSVSLGNPPNSTVPLVADALAVLPGNPHSWVTSLCVAGNFPSACGQGLTVYDDVVARPTAVPLQGAQAGFDSLLFVGKDATKLYSTSAQLGFATSFSQFSIAADGITFVRAVPTPPTTPPVLNGGMLDTDGTNLYVSNGQVVILPAFTVSNPFPEFTSNLPGIKVDSPASRVYFSGQVPTPRNSPIAPFFEGVQAYDLQNHQLVGDLRIAEGLAYSNIARWTNNGLILTGDAGIFIIRSSVTGVGALSTDFSVRALNPLTVLAGSPDLALKITGTGFVAGDTIAANNTALQSAFVSATEIDATVPASLLTAAGSVQISVTTPANKTAYLVLVIAPGAPVASVTPTSLSFDPLLVGSKSAPQNVTISNTGTSPLHISNITVSGDYSQTNNCTPVAPGASCTVAVVFQPSAPNPREGLLTIADDDASTQQTIGLNGTGTDVQVAPGSTGSTASVSAGQPANYALTITPAGGFTGAVTFSCTNLPKYAACSITPPSATLATAAVNVAVTITTSQTQNASLLLPSAISAGISWLGLLLVASFWPLRRTLCQSRFVTATALAALTLCAAAFIFAGCGGGSSSGGSAPPPPQSTTVTTPQGTYTVNFVVTSQAGSRTTPLTLNVQ